MNTATLKNQKLIAIVEGIEYSKEYRNYYDIETTTKDIEVKDDKIVFNFEYTRYEKVDKIIIEEPRKPFYENDTPIFFETGGITKVEYNDGMGHRSCHVSLLIYCKNKAYRFFGNDIPNIAVIENSSYSKNGKWSNTTYSIALASGWKAVKIQQGWNSGVYIDDVTSVKAMKECLGLDKEVSNAVVLELVKIEFNKTYLRHLDYQTKMDDLMTATEENDTEIVYYTYVKSRINKRTGMNVLLLNDYPWNEEESDLVKIISRERISGMGGGSTTYKLALDSTVTIEEVAECDPYGGDDEALEHRFYLDENDVYQRIGGSNSVETNEVNEENNPFFKLKGLIK